MEGLSLLETVRRVKPNILIGISLPVSARSRLKTNYSGLSACGGLFTEDILKAMNENESPPVIFPLSNPTSRSECTAAQAQAATNGRAIFASGSPFQDINIGETVAASSQCNNRSLSPPASS